MSGKRSATVRLGAFACVLTTALVSGCASGSEGPENGAPAGSGGTAGGGGTSGGGGTAGITNDCECPGQASASSPYIGPIECTLPASGPGCAETLDAQLAFLAATPLGGVIFAGCARTITRVSLDGYNEVDCAYGSDDVFVAAMRTDTGEDRQCEDVLFWQTGELPPSCDQQTRCWVGSGELPLDEESCD